MSKENLMIEYRRKNRKVKVEKEEWTAMESECKVLVSHNGYQYSVIFVDIEEAKMVIEKLQEYFNI